MLTSASSLPLLANSGQTVATLASRSSKPRSAATCAQNADAPLVQEKTTQIVSRSQGSPSTALHPPQRSTTVRPSSVSETLAPTSPRVAKFSTNASATAEHLASQVPLTVPFAILRSIVTMFPATLMCREKLSRHRASMSNGQRAHPATMLDRFHV